MEKIRHTVSKAASTVFFFVLYTRTTSVFCISNKKTGAEQSVADFFCNTKNGSFRSFCSISGGGVSICPKHRSLEKYGRSPGLRSHAAACRPDAFSEKISNGILPGPKTPTVMAVAADFDRIPFSRKLPFAPYFPDISI